MPHSCRLATLATVVFLLLLPSALVAQKHPITHEDVYTARRIGAPALSPDGRWVVFQVSEPAYDEKDQSSDLWIAATDGSAAPRQLTVTKGGESGAAWSPDGRRVAFSARREGDEVAQIYVLDAGQPGEARRVTGVSTGARAPRWRPDGKAILFTSDVYPGARSDEENRKAAGERRARKWNARVYDSFPVRDWDRWLDDRRPTLLVQTIEPAGQAKDLLAGSGLAMAPGFAGQWGSGGDSIAAAWTPDGAAVVFAATTGRSAAAFSEPVQSLWLVPAAGGEPTRLTPDAGSYSQPAFSPDGRFIFAGREPATDRIYNLTRLVRFDWPAMANTATLTAAFEWPAARRRKSGASPAERNYHLLASPGYVVLLTNYTGSTGFGEKFAQAIQGDPLEGPGNEVNEAADEAIRRFPYIDAARQAAAGASYGGHLANWLAVTTTRYRALVSHAGLSDQAMQWGTSDTIYGRERAADGAPWEGSPVWAKQSPLQRAGSLRTPMLVSVGERDYRVPMNNAILMFSALQRMKVPSRLIVFPTENHWVLSGENSRFWYGEVHAWLAKYLAPAAPSH